MDYNNFNKILTVKRSSYTRLLGDFLDEFDKCVVSMQEIESQLVNGITYINCQYPNLTIYAGGEYSQENRTLEVSGKIKCPNSVVTIQSGENIASRLSMESVVILDAIDSYRPIIAKSMSPKDIYHVETNWRYNFDLPLAYDDLLATHIPSNRQVASRKIPLKHPNVEKLEFNLDLTNQATRPALKTYCIRNGIPITSTLVKVNTPLLVGENITIDSRKVFPPIGVSMTGNSVWVSDLSRQDSQSILSPTYVHSTYARRDLSNVTTLILARDGIALEENDAIAKEEVEELMSSKLPTSITSLPLSTKTVSTSANNVVSDVDIANILTKMVEDIYANILLNTRESKRAQIDKLIEDKINSLKNTFAIMSDCLEMPLKAQRMSCELSDADFRALKPNRLIEKWLFKQLLKRSLLDCGNEAAYWVRQ